MNQYKFIHILWSGGALFNKRIIEIFNDEEKDFDIDDHLFVTPYKHIYDEICSFANVVFEQEINPRSAELVNKYSEFGDWVFLHGMCSTIENHSSTLKEAMTVGAPCIASYVGGVPEYAKNGENCLLYRYEDYEVLAQNICKLFEDKQLRERLSQTAREQLRKPKEKTDYEKMREILIEVAEENKR